MSALDRILASAVTETWQLAQLVHESLAARAVMTGEPEHIAEAAEAYLLLQVARENHAAALEAA